MTNAYDVTPAPSRNGLGITSLILGILSLVFFAVPVMNYLAVVLGVVGLILALVSLRKKRAKGLAIAGGVLSVIGVILSIITIILYAAVVSGVSKAVSAESTPSVSASQSSAAPTANVPVAQQQATTAAKGYLALGSGFSRQGLIAQLSSSAGNGFSVADATTAVDSLKVDYNAQAVLAAKGYIKMGGFSHQSLVQQLSATTGSQFTPEQSEYAATQVGL
jgi:hypothetical protein